MEGIKDWTVVEAVQDSGQEAVTALGRLRKTNGMCKILPGHLEPRFPCGSEAAEDCESVGGFPIFSAYVMASLS